VKGSTLLLVILALVAIAVTVVNYLPQDVFRPDPGLPDSSAASDSLIKDEPPAQDPPQVPDLSSLRDSVMAITARRDSVRVQKPDQPRPQSSYSIEIQKSAFKLVLNRDDKPFKVYNIAVGNQGSDKLDKNDLITPLGSFYVVSIENSAQRSPKQGRQFGPWFIRLLTGHFQTASGKAWSGIGIQGGGKPSEIGHSLPTDGVILQDNDLIELKEYIHEDYKEYRLPVRIVP